MVTAQADLDFRIWLREKSIKFSLRGLCVSLDEKFREEVYPRGNPYFRNGNFKFETDQRHFSQ